jgi:hypothetical protein
MKGQLEVSFQWVYVLLAGGAFLVMFFFIFRACTTQGEDRIQTSALTVQTQSLNAIVWRAGEKNITLDSIPVCAGGTLTLTKDGKSLQLNAPAFLSPKLGKSTAVTKEVALQASGTPALPFGNVVYVMDQSTPYYVIMDANQQYKEITTLLPQVKTLTAESVIPANAIVASYGSLNGKGGKYGVAFTDDEIIFYAKGSSGLQEVRRLSGAGAFLRAGALIAATPELYSCAKDQAAKRASYLQALYSERIGELPESDCTQTLLEANQTLARAAPTAFLDGTSPDATKLLLYQQALNGMGCPVIG